LVYYDKSIKNFLECVYFGNIAIINYMEEDDLFEKHSDCNYGSEDDFCASQDNYPYKICKYTEAENRMYSIILIQ